MSERTEVTWTDAEREVVRRFVRQLHGRMFDETPSGNGGTDALSLAREAGYRAGHNDATRGIIKFGEGL